MAYVRFSSDDYQSDVYTYEDCDGGWITHVANVRYRFRSPLPPPVDMDANMEGWLARHQKVSAMVEQAERVPIKSSVAGERFHDNTPGEAADRLLALRELGIRVPQHAIDQLREEQLGAPRWAVITEARRNKILRALQPADTRFTVLEPGTLENGRLTLSIGLHANRTPVAVVTVLALLPDDPKEIEVIVAPSDHQIMLVGLATFSEPGEAHVERIQASDVRYTVDGFDLTAFRLDAPPAGVNRSYQDYPKAPDFGVLTPERRLTLRLTAPERPVVVGFAFTYGSIPARRATPGKDAQP